MHNGKNADRMSLIKRLITHYFNHVASYNFSILACNKVMIQLGSTKYSTECFHMSNNCRSKLFPHAEVQKLHSLLL